MERYIHSEIALKELGRQLAELIRGGEVIEMIGDVGAGKTTLTKGIGAGLGITEPIQSPTYTISRTYDTPGGLVLAHYDFYRLHDAGIMADELREVASDTQTITIIEWAEVVAGVLPKDRLTITITARSVDERDVVLHAGGPMSARLIEGLV